MILAHFMPVRIAWVDCPGTLMDGRIMPGLERATGASPWSDPSTELRGLAPAARQQRIRHENRTR